MRLILQFVAHPNVQQLLASIWYEGLPGFRRRNMALQALEVIRIGLLFPFFSLCYIVAPKSSWGQTMRKPFIKFICHSASYFTFLCKNLFYFIIFKPTHLIYLSMLITEWNMDNLWMTQDKTIWQNLIFKKKIFTNNLPKFVYISYRFSMKWHRSKH